MQDKYIKDITILIGVIILFVISFRVYFLFNKADRVSVESIHVGLGLDQALLDQIKQIEMSIRDRKDFRFTVDRDPLKQDLVVQTQLDLLREWEAMVRRMMRLSSVFIDSEGNETAVIVWNGRNNTVRVGDTLNNKTITRITLDRLYYTEGGRAGTIIRQPVPPRPTAPDTRGRNDRLENW